MAKEILGYIKLQIPAGSANPSPPVGPALGQRGLNIMDFCKAFNDKTKDVEKGAPIPVVITAYKDRSFDFVTKLPPVSYYLKKAAKIKKGNSTPGRSLVGKVTFSDIEKIAMSASRTPLSLKHNWSSESNLSSELSDKSACATKYKA